jgi:hypothetical protein
MQERGHFIQSATTRKIARMDQDVAFGHLQFVVLKVGVGNKYYFHRGEWLNKFRNICTFAANILSMTTLELAPHYITDSTGKQVSVVLSIDIFQKLLELLEELEDIRLYDEVKNRKEDVISVAEYRAQRKLPAHA